MAANIFSPSSCAWGRSATKNGADVQLNYGKKTGRGHREHAERWSIEDELVSAQPRTRGDDRKMPEAEAISKEVE
ncbi:MAG TPA: hypothetical protein PLK80_16845, partial [bacterium]|nr:hypothetical protein [bacterium]